MSDDQRRIYEAHVAAIDGRMGNVRTRHEVLRQLFASVQKEREEVVQAVCRDYFQTNRLEYGRASLDLVLTHIAQHASQLDQPADVREKHAVENLRGPAVHLHSQARGLVGVIVADENVKHPIDAILSPTAAAVAAGNVVIVLLPASKSQTATLLHRLFAQCFDGQVLCVATMASIHTLVDVADQLVCFGQAEELKAGGRPVIQIAAQATSVAVVDASIVHDSFYRSTKQSARDKEAIRKAATSIAHSQRHAKQTVFVSENIFEAFTNVYVEQGGKADEVRSTRSIEHVLSFLHTLTVDHLTIFASGKFASFYANNVPCHSVSIDCQPTEFQLGYAPPGSSLERNADQTLKPLWTGNLFTRQTPIVKSVCSPSSFAPSPPVKTTLAPLKRGKSDHIDFFPTGFVITAFPTFGILAGLTGYCTYRLLTFSYRALSQRL